MKAVPDLNLSPFLSLAFRVERPPLRCRGRAPFPPAPCLFFVWGVFCPCEIPDWRFFAPAMARRQGRVEKKGSWVKRHDAARTCSPAPLFPLFPSFVLPFMPALSVLPSFLSPFTHTLPSTAPAWLPHLLSPLLSLFLTPHTVTPPPPACATSCKPWRTRRPPSRTRWPGRPSSTRPGRRPSAWASASRTSGWAGAGAWWAGMRPAWRARTGRRARWSLPRRRLGRVITS